MIKVVVLLTSIFLVNEVGYAQSYKNFTKSDSLTTKFWTTEDGLPINTINQITQDDNGYLWLTTYDGIVRFDGLEFTTFNNSNTPEIPHNRATEMYKQDGVGIWISMENEGVLLIDEKGFHHFGIEDGFSKSDVTQIMEDSRGRMFFVTHDGLYVYEEKMFKQYFHGKDNYQDKIRYVYEDKDESIWIATNNGLIHSLNGEFLEYNVSSNQLENIFFNIFRNSEGELLAGSTSGLFLFDNNALVIPKRFDMLKDADVYRIFEYEKTTFISTYQGLYLLKRGKISKIHDPFRKFDEAYYTYMKDSDGLFWLIGDRGTLCVYKDGKLSEVEALTQTNLDYFISVFQDRENSIWITTPREGLIRINKTLVRTIGQEEGLSEGNILGMLKDSRGRYWIGTRGGGLNLIDGDKITHFKEHREISSSIVQSIAEDSLGNIWIGHYQKGLNKISDHGIEHYMLFDKFDQSNVHALYTTSDGQLWVGTYAGLIKFDQVNFNHTLYTKEQGLSGDKIRYITQANDKSLWIGTLDGGISNFKDDGITNYTLEDGLSSDNIRSIYVDEKEEGTIWVGTENNGLNRITEEGIEYVSIADGIPNYNIHWISEDDDGWLWMSSNKGVFKILKSSLNDYFDEKSSSFRMIVYGNDEGMRNPEGNGSIQEAGIRDKNNTFMFATQEGVAIFENSDRDLTGFNPKVVIKEVTAKGISFATDSISFDSNIDDFSVKVHAITLLNPKKTRFRYRIEDFDNIKSDWIETGIGREISLTDLSHGDYKLEVQATDKSGAWMVDSATLIFSINPKFYETAWFILISTASLVLMFVGGWRIRYKRLLFKQKEMERVIEEQLSQIKKEKKAVEGQKEIIEKQALILEETNKTKDKFFSIIAHDLRNPFQSLLGYTDFLYSDFDNVDDSELKEGLSTIKDSAKKLLTLTENLLEWANIQTGKVTPTPKMFSLNKVISENIDLFLQSAEQKEIHLTFNEGPDKNLFADENMMKTVIRNLISNSIKFTKKDGFVTVHTVCEGENCKISISDTGIGMNNKLLSGVMSLDSKSTREGTNREAGSGLGLILCKEMIEMNFGTLEIESEENVGTTFTISLPCKE